MARTAKTGGIPIFDSSRANDPLLEQLHDTLFNVGFLYAKNCGVATETTSNLVTRLPVDAKLAIPHHFLGYLQ